MPVWLCFVLSMVPFTIFLFIRQGEMPDKIVKTTHSFGVVWYIAVAAYVFFEFSTIGFSNESIVYSIFISLGFIPCILIAIKAFLKIIHRKVL